MSDGKHVTLLADRKSLSGNLPFRVGAEIGGQIDPRWSVSLFFDHENNGDFARYDEVLNNSGLRLGFGL
jgi:formylmethanofuran dehydrogenase subunit A